MNNQRHLFNLPDDQIYLNGAYMSPQLKSVEEIGIINIKRKSNPGAIKPKDFFTGQILLKQAYSTLINAENPDHIAIIPSVSYGISTAAQNIPLKSGDEIIVVDEQFPSNIYPWQSRAIDIGVKINTIRPSESFQDRGALWNAAILSAITSKTKIVAMPQVHWADGTLFDLVAIGQKVRSVGGYLVIDGTPSVGALPFDIQSIKPDVLICGGYKWLLGPYSLGVAYFSKRMHDGIPLEHNWMNRFESEDFANLTQYQDKYQPGAQRFSVGESSNFVYVPMLKTAIDQLNDWGPINIQRYCADITREGINALTSAGYLIEDGQYRANHLIGIYLPEEKDMATIKAKLAQNNIVISVRGRAVRVSPNVYNTKEEFDVLVKVLLEE